MDGTSAPAARPTGRRIPAAALAAAAALVLAVWQGAALRAERRAADSFAERAAALAPSASGTRGDAAVVSFASVALGGFRGVLADALWLRATRLQQERRFVELVQLSDWITRLEPGNEDMWAYHAWNLAYNVSFLVRPWKEGAAGRGGDRWRWVRSGIELLRDRGIPMNPRSGRLKHELAWLFYHKLGFSSFSDEDAPHYRTEWAREIAPALGRGGTVPSPETCGSAAAADAASALLRGTFKMDPDRMRELERRFGPFDWRVPAASVVYWATLGIDEGGAGVYDLSCRRDVYCALGDMLRGAGRYAGDPADPDWRADSSLRPQTSVADAAAAFALDAVSRTTMPGTKIAAAGLLRDAAYVRLAEGRDAEARAFYDRLVSFLRSIGIRGDVPSFGELASTPPSFFDDLLVRNGFD